MRSVAIHKWFFASCVIATACSSGPIAPFVGTPGALDGPLSLSGRIVSQDQVPIAGSTVEVSQGGRGTFTANQDGQFVVAGLSTGLVQMTLSAPGYLTHRTKVNLTSSRTGFVLDLIASAAPFDLQFYREFARGTFDGPTVQATRRWTMNPSFYLHTTTSDTGDPVSPTVLADIERIFGNAVPELTGGLYRVATVEKGAGPGGVASGWVEVLFYDGEIPGSFGLGGDSFIGGNAGRIRIRSNPALDLLPLRGCPSFPVRVADHEIVHAMGFWHSTDNFNDFYSGASCSGAGRPARVPFHAAVMYSRPRGNTDVDDDPGDFVYPMAQPSRTSVGVSCALESFLKR